MSTLRRPRGSALLVTLGTTSFLMVMIAGIISYSGQVQTRSVASMRGMKRLNCAQTGLQLAKAFWGRKFNEAPDPGCPGPWGHYLCNPSIYNPFKASWNPSPATPLLPNGNVSSTLLASNPELFADLDGDGTPDVYIYIRDNVDEFLPAQPNPTRDNDQAVVVGALCISSTLRPRRADGMLDPNIEYVEGLLAFNVANGVYRSALTNMGNGNWNN